MNFLEVRISLYLECVIKLYICLLWQKSAIIRWNKRFSCLLRNFYFIFIWLPFFFVFLLRHCISFPYLSVIASLCFIVNFNLIVLLKRFNICIICVVYCSPRSRKANFFGKFCRFQLFHDLILQLYLDYHRSFWCVENYFSFISFYI